MTAVRYWAVHKRGTQEYLPLNNRGGPRGITNLEPTDLSVAPPRLFMSEASAQRALSVWVKGRKVRTRGPYGFLVEPDHAPKVVTAPAPDRKRGDFQVVAVDLSIVGKVDERVNAV